MAERKPEFISLMRTIRDVYYKEMGEAVAFIQASSNTFYAYVNQIKNAVIRTVTTVPPVSDIELGVATVVVDTTTDPNKMQFDFGIPAGLRGLKGDTGQGVTVNGSDTYANIILNTSALLGECYISTTVPVLLPPSGTPSVGDGLTPLIDNPQVEADWINIGLMQGPAGDDGDDGTNGTNGTNGANGEKWWITPTIPVNIGDIPGSIVGDLALVSTFEGESTNGAYYELFGSGWISQGVLSGSRGPDGTPGSIWYQGSGVPSDILGINNDFYVDVSGNNYYNKQADTWGAPVGNLDANAISSIAGGGGVPGSDQVTLIVSCTQAEYDASTPEPGVTYLIVG